MSQADKVTVLFMQTKPQNTIEEGHLSKRVTLPSCKQDVSNLLVSAKLTSTPHNKICPTYGSFQCDENCLKCNLACENRRLVKLFKRKPSLVLEIFSLLFPLNRIEPRSWERAAKRRKKKTSGHYRTESHFHVNLKISINRVRINLIVLL